MPPDQHGHSIADNRTTFFGVIAEPRSYRNIIYLLLGLPLGTFYFTVLVTGISLGIGLLVVALIGIPIMMGLWYITRAFMRFERMLAMGLLDAVIAPMA